MLISLHEESPARNNSLCHTPLPASLEPEQGDFRLQNDIGSTTSSFSRDATSRILQRHAEIDASEEHALSTNNSSPSYCPSGKVRELDPSYDAAARSSDLTNLTVTKPAVPKPTVATSGVPAADSLTQQPASDQLSNAATPRCYDGGSLILGSLHRQRHSEGIYHCNTQPGEECNPTAIRLGFRGRISRYHTDFAISYYVDLETFQAVGDGEMAANCFELAILAWKLDRVHFERVFSPEGAFFSVVGSKDAPDSQTMADSFFPNYPPAKRRVMVFPLAFEYPDAMVNLFCHELGHMLGLRHEFAAQREGGIPSVCWGCANSDSVMNYYKHPIEMAVHELDIQHINEFYTYEGSRFKGFPVDIVWPLV
ncbi:hypothetical protein F5Y04DRAFT_263665 [Hypomontagnella monticulosa]|nr:hypothetical protein F5Y04DRAFT_263665 [Hypomontagnella monticulosa]